MRRRSTTDFHKLYRFSAVHVASGSNALTVPSPVRIRQKRHRRPQLDKVGGMEKDVRRFIAAHCSMNPENTSILRTSVSTTIHHLPKKSDTIVNLKRINDVRGINQFLYAVNEHLDDGGTFIGCVETKYLRRRRLMKKFPAVLREVYYVLDFFLKRVFPKLVITRPVYQLLSGERNKVLSRTETLGRLYAAGFEVKAMEFIGNNLYFVVNKVKKPIFKHERVYGPVIRMRRHGKDGKLIHVYKLRTMHAYSEFIQKYVYDKNNLATGGKMKDDFRVSTLGRFFRKYWIDELPMIINVLKGDLKLIGVRPLSAHYLSLYSEELREKRLSHKPGLIPPFYVDLPKTLSEIMASEMAYLKAYEKNPWLTDFRYFFKAVVNIVFNKARSK